jgi:hypothetical protein
MASRTEPGANSCTGSRVVPSGERDAALPAAVRPSDPSGRQEDGFAGGVVESVAAAGAVKTGTAVFG